MTAVPSLRLPSIALPTGPYDRHPEIIPQAVFWDRVAAVRALMRQRNIDRAIVHGNGFDHGALAWLTGFTPKLGPAWLLLPVEGEPRLLFAGGPGMRPSAVRLTWVADVVALKGIAVDLAPWLASLAPGGAAPQPPQRVGLVEGRAIACADYLAVTRTARGETVELDSAFDSLRRRKSDLELDLIRRSAAILSSAASEFCSTAATTGVRSAALAAERHAYAEGAQDVRIRIGHAAWAAPIALGTNDPHVDGPVAVAIALRASGHFVSGQFVAGALSPDISDIVRRALNAAGERMRPGATLADLTGPQASRGDCICAGTGLAPEETPVLAEGDRLMDGDVCTLARSITLPSGHRAVWSLIAAVRDGAPEMIWMPPGL